MNEPTRNDAPERGECHWRDTAHSFVLGALEEAEASAFREHLLEGCGACGLELEEARATVAELDLASTRESAGRRASLPPSLRARVLARAADPDGRRAADRGAEPAKTPFSSLFEDEAGGGREYRVPSSLPGVVLVLDSSEGWVQTTAQGVEFKLLSEDAERRYATALVRMAPGSSYPRHRHHGVEECYVISGDVELGDHRFGAGDYLVSEAGSIHPPHETERGCVLLIVSSQEDELLGG